MSWYDIKTITGLIAMLIALLLSFVYFKRLDKPTKILSLYLAITFTNEIIANIGAYLFHNSNIVYGIFSPVELLLISMYFNYSIDNFRKNNTGIIIGAIGLLIGFIDLFIIQSPNSLNHFFLILESISICAMCLYAFFRLLILDDNLHILRLPHFWFTVIFFFFWTSTLFIWGTFDFLTQKADIAYSIILTALFIINIITYLGFGTVFLLYRKMLKTNE